MNTSKNLVNLLAGYETMFPRECGDATTFYDLNMWTRERIFNLLYTVLHLRQDHDLFVTDVERADVKLTYADVDCMQYDLNLDPVLGMCPPIMASVDVPTNGDFVVPTRARVVRTDYRLLRVEGENAMVMDADGTMRYCDFLDRRLMEKIVGWMDVDDDAEFVDACRECLVRWTGLERAIGHLGTTFFGDPVPGLARFFDPIAEVLFGQGAWVTN